MRCWSTVVVVVLMPAVMGCAELGGGRALPEQVVEAAYLEARGPTVTCHGGDAGCCRQQVAAARAASAGGQSATAARLWQEVALACPDTRNEAGAAASVIPPVSPSPGSLAEPLNVTYRVRLPASVRLYWVSASVGARLLPVRAAAAPQPVDVEVQAIRFTGGRPGPLLVVTRRLEVAFQPGGQVTIDIAEPPPGSATPLAVSAQVQPPPRASTPPAAPPPRRGPPPRLEPSQVISLQSPRHPRELNLSASAYPATRFCLDREGNLDTVRFLEAPHPRIAASFIDQLRDARYEPYRVNDIAVPSCDLRPATVEGS